ncbi:DNA methylase, putative [Labilithrix luteola]|uniref:DNA methylase, putative n=1 Tax=Labilithrix luteola TaxID=1391654 RepID=A0A0K1Q2W5_9BACT|nr:DUF559 domain-containing protein [Labilithrix luteola]AKU99709.1 DNA methylase, putative [Labilithrix luteola]
MGRDAYAVMTSTLGALDSYQLAEHLNRDIAHSSIVLRAARDMVQFWNEEHQREFGRPAFALENLGPEWRADEALEAARPNQKYPRPTTALLPGLMRLELLEHVAALKLGPRWLGLGIPGLRTPSRRAARALRDALGGSEGPSLGAHPRGALEVLMFGRSLVTQLLEERARVMRFAPTRSEEWLWRCLSGSKLGFAFRRQLVIGPYIVDFACTKVRLVVEVDGPYHEERSRPDARRDAALGRLGWHVLRVSDREVLEELASVVTRIHTAATALA